MKRTLTIIGVVLAILVIVGLAIAFCLWRLSGLFDTGLSEDISGEDSGSITEVIKDKDLPQTHSGLKAPPPTIAVEKFGDIIRNNGTEIDRPSSINILGAEDCIFYRGVYRGEYEGRFGFESIVGGPLYGSSGLTVQGTRHPESDVITECDIVGLRYGDYVEVLIKDDQLWYCRNYGPESGVCYFITADSITTKDDLIIEQQGSPYRVICKPNTEWLWGQFPTGEYKTQPADLEIGNTVFVLASSTKLTNGKLEIEAAEIWFLE